MDFKSYKQKKERGVSNKEIIDDLNEREAAGEINEMIAIAVGVDDSIKYSFSSDSILRVIGAMESIKQELIRILDEQMEEQNGGKD